MTVDIYILLIIIGCGIVTVIPRVLPFIVIRNLTLPDNVVKWLSFVPVTIFTALIVDSMIIQSEDALLTIDWQTVIAVIPTLIVALLSKSLSLTVLVGIITMAAVRFVM